MAAPPASSAGTRTNRDGLRFGSPAPETYVFPAELHQRYSQLSSPQDSFVFIINGKMEPLPSDWYATQNWEKIEVVGAVASLNGPDTLLVQSGWFSQIAWRWLHLGTIGHIVIKSDRRFRKGRYAMLSPHKGYAPHWESSITVLTKLDPVPRFRRCSPNDPVPSWWDAAAMDLWTGVVQGSVVASLKRPAPTPPEQLERSTSHDQRDSATNAVVAVPNFTQKCRPTLLTAFAELVWSLDGDKVGDNKRARNQ
ncbi:hypothetical protein FRC10_008584 [Ceratobasidium sp. 414]|nr:hypothetical protein FRC10_008584 [Ceratobasidium sp. 414]